MSAQGGRAAHIAAEAAARRSYGKLVAYLAARSRDVASAEDALAEAFATALEQWPTIGVPEKPEAWLLTVARRKQIDAARKHQRGDAAEPQLKIIHEELAAAAEAPMHIPDRRLALMFVCAHPAIDPAVRTPLILQTVLGFDAATIASAFLVSPASMSQRLVRAKTKIREAGIAFLEPAPEDLAERLDAVLEAVYAAFTQSWADADPVGVARGDLAHEAIFLGRLLTELMPNEPEVLGQMALMLFAESRRAARRSAQGDYVPLSEQDIRLWDHELIKEAEAHLQAASKLGRIGRFQLEAAVQSAHAARASSGRTDWHAIEALYDGLLTLSGSSVVAINRAVAIAETRGPEAALAALAEAENAGGMLQYQPYWAARASLLARAGDPVAANAAYGEAIALATDPAIRGFLNARRQALRN